MYLYETQNEIQGRYQWNEILFGVLGQINDTSMRLQEPLA